MFALALDEYADPKLNELAKVDYVAHGIIMPIFLSIGFLNQCMNVKTLSQLPSPGFLYLKASAIADILSIVALIPFVLRHMHVHYCYSYLAMFYHAHLELPIANSLITTSALCIVSMTIDRYLSICHPIKFFNNVESRKRIKNTIGCLYFISILVYIPSCWQNYVHGESMVNLNISSRDRLDDYCKLDVHYKGIIYMKRLNEELNFSIIFTGYLFSREIISRIGPILILVLLNLLMAKSLSKFHQRNLDRRRSFRRSSNSERNRISVLLFITSATFIICNLPASLLSVFKGRLTDQSIGYQIFRASCNLIQSTSYLYNFYLYTLCSSEYREAFIKIINCKRYIDEKEGNSKFVRGSKMILSVNSKDKNIVPLLNSPTHALSTRSPESP
ncbi:G protein-coupled receptor, rhodopsin-like family and GPCR, rhodopsin-like, 7TM domain-containing protein [Strongyloides ratti]|uniref:G protein-coupled receptor, rhodopsin-like family and GPCR, rhodopsin-like, 7TM domain-containing protein n=1 Tax=Strongyloides ratti TaxID=34506 RepID=A0A090KWW9_STRRB|nr:G protein-coupled receptor, rhodopsin-like family and GPCR, rhodopsin-like, 7TM domain-containing protein [Strongyloides ratti]CEF62005.1 G protein-coupled receptor, rhodopsin-like family and GPCR, rhodopsin-like, 7TM domain-containing protein [Strongyloides ratti]